MEASYAKYFTRKTLKKSIMIYNYHGSFHTCLNDFLEQLPTNISAATKDQLIIKFQAFYKFLEQIFTQTEIFIYPAEHLYTFLFFTNPNLRTTLTKYLELNPKPSALTKFLKNINKLDELWLKKIGVQGLGPVTSSAVVDTELTIDINKLLDDYKLGNLKNSSFESFLRKYKLLENFKKKFKHDKFINALTYSTFSVHEGIIKEQHILAYLYHLQVTHTETVKRFFTVKLDDGFSISYDYIETTEEKVDLKLRYNQELQAF